MQSDTPLAALAGGSGLFRPAVACPPGTSRSHNPAIDSYPQRSQQTLAKTSIVLPGLNFICAAAAFALAAVIMASIVGIPEGADFRSYEYLRGNPGVLILTLAGVYIVSSFAEEVLFRGYLMTRCTEMFASRKQGQWIAIAVSTLVFALIHYDWGIAGVVQTGFMGFVLAYAFFRVKRNLWVNIIAHGILDTILIVQLYLA